MCYFTWARKLTRKADIYENAKYVLCNTHLSGGFIQPVLTSSVATYLGDFENISEL